MTTHMKDFSEISSRSVSLPETPTRTYRILTYKSHFKRVFDVLFVVAAAPIAAPLVALFALFAALDGASPFYRQRRIGRNGYAFNMLKIRSMVPNAHDRLAHHLAGNPAARAEWDSTQKLKNDPRITLFGKILRKSSLDELPQLWNVLRGDMSIVGPRPIMPEQIHLYPGTEYYAMRPGLTGLWQVSDRNETTFAERAMYDTAYYQSLSLKSDLSILARTVGVVLRCTGY